MEEFKGQNILNLVKELPNDDACKAYLSKIKWMDGFKCTKCGSVKGCEKSGFNYHCYTCNHVESATADTLFHKGKFGLQKTLLIVFEITISSKRLSSVQMVKRYGIGQKAAWFFMQKVLVSMTSSQKYPLS